MGRIVIVLIAVMAGLHCTPDLAPNTCTTNADCLVGEICHETECVEERDSVDAQTDLQDLQPEDIVSDARDVSDGGLSDSEPFDQQSDRDTAMDSETGADSDLTDESEVTDVAEELVDSDIEVSDSDIDAADLDSPDLEVDTGPTCANELFAHSIPLSITETCTESASCGEGHLPVLCAANAWENAVVEVPLVNGIIDHSVTHYLSFDEPGNQAPQPVEGAYTWIHYESPRTLQTPWDSDDGPSGFGLARKYDGQHYDELSSYPLFQADSFTITAWIRVCLPGEGDDDICGSGDQVFMRAHGTSDPEDAFMVTLTDSGMSLLTRNETNVLSADPTIPIPQGWFHFAVVQPSRSLPQLYIDGVPVPVDWSTDELVPATGFPGLSIGGSLDEDDANFVGLVDDLVVARRAFTAVEVQALVSTNAPFGTVLVPGASADFRDVRITTGPNEIEQVADFEFVGPRPTIVEPRSGMCLLDFDFGSEGDGIADCHDFVTDWTAESVGRFGYDSDGHLAAGGGETNFPTGLVPDLRLADSFSLSFWFRQIESVGEEPVSVRNGAMTWLAIGPDEITVPFLDPPLSGSSHRSSTDGWHHVALVHFVTSPKRYALFIDGVEVDNCTEEGASCAFSGVATVPEDLLVIGAVNPDSIELMIDDFLFYPQALSSNHLASVAYPPLPSVRLLPDTTTAEGDCSVHGNQFHDYRLVWGNPSVTPYQGYSLDECEGLLSDCNGFIGVWLFDEGVGPLIRDRSANHLHVGDLRDTPQWEALGQDRVGLSLQSNAMIALISDSSAVAMSGQDGENVSIEALLRPGSEIIQTIALLTGDTDMFRFGLSGNAPSFSFDAEDEFTVSLKPFGVSTMTPFAWGSVAVSHTFGEGGATDFHVNGTVLAEGDDDNRDALPAAGSHNFFVASDGDDAEFNDLVGAIGGLVIRNTKTDNLTLRLTRPVAQVWWNRADWAGATCVEIP